MNVVERIGEPAALELLAEECVELSHAALKLARFERGENPTPTTERAAKENVLEEMADVSIVISHFMKELGWVNRGELDAIIHYKEDRMERRLNETGVQ